MQHLKRLLWLAFAGFVTAAGASLAIAIAITVFGTYSQERERAAYKPDPSNYQPPVPGEVTVSDLALLEITKSGGVRGILRNDSKRKINSFRANLEFLKQNEILFSCSETVMVDVESGKSARFQLLCKEVDRAALPPDVVPRLSLVWVYPSREE